jgi:hypothetical protein
MSTAVAEAVNLSSRLTQAVTDAADDDTDGKIWHTLREDSQRLMENLEPSQPDDIVRKYHIITSDIYAGLTMVLERSQNRPLASAVSSVFSAEDLTSLARSLEEIQMEAGNISISATRR